MADTGSHHGMTAEVTTVIGDDDTPIRVYFARPQGPGPYPGVILLHHVIGWDELYFEFTRRFAHHGYLAIAPDLYSRYGSGEPDDVAARARADGGPPDDQVVSDASGCVRFLRSLPVSDGKVGMFGTCSGGRHGFLAACRGEPVDALINCWGGRVVAGPDDLTDRQPVAPVDYTASLPCPVLGIFGNDDKQPAPAHVDALETALDEHGKAWEHHRYDGAGHAFFSHDRPSHYRAEQAVDGWERIWDFLDRTVA